MKTLIDLYQSHQGKVSDKWSSYLSQYHHMFAPIRSDVKHMLEIGIQNGGSLEIWSKYFPSVQKLIGCDINPDCSRLTYEDPRIAVVVGDANTDGTYRKVLEQAAEFDLIIDDGSHTSSDIVRSFARYFPHLKQGGMFVAEDLHCSYWAEYEGGLYDPFSSIAFFKRLADVVNHEHWGTDADRAKVLRGFYAEYGFELAEEVLAEIHSVIFVNSVCLVTKRLADQNSLGERFIAGESEVVVEGIAATDGSRLSAIPQRGNVWSVLSNPPDEMWIEQQQKISELEASIGEMVADLDQLRLAKAELEQSKAELELSKTDLERNKASLEQNVAELVRVQNEIVSSSSWRLTHPLRTAVTQARRFGRVGARALKIAQRDGLKRTANRALEVYKGEGLQGIQSRLAPVTASAQQSLEGYTKWIAEFDTLSSEQVNLLKARVASFNATPLISIVMPTYNPNPDWLAEAIESVLAQIYPHWELCIADDASPDPAIRSVLESYATRDSRIKVVFREQNGHISAASNSALEIATGEWVALLDHDDLLPVHALFCVAEAVNSHPQARLIYSDEDKIDEEGRRRDPYFKCAWNRDLFYSHNMISHLGVYQRHLMQEVGGFRVGLEGSQDYDLALRCIERIEPSQIHHIPRVLYHWRVHAESTAGGAVAKPYAAVAGVRALHEHFERTGRKGKHDATSTGYRVRYELPATLPLVTLIIPTRNALGLMRQCITSIIDRTSYPNYEVIIVDNGSDDEAALGYFYQLSKRENFRILRDERPFNYSALNNAAVKEAKGEIIGLINNDIQVISPDWLNEMVSIALQPGVGAVGAKLLYPDNSVQHAGVVMGMGGVAGHAHKNIQRHDPGYFCRAGAISSFSAVTAACLVIRKSIYLEVGALNESDLKVAFNDVDFCLKVLEAGYRNVWTPYAELYHHESATRGIEDNPVKQARFNSEVQYMHERWGHTFELDPAYSPNLTLDRSDFSYAWPPRVRSLLDE